MYVVHGTKIAQFFNTDDVRLQIDFVESEATVFTHLCVSLAIFFRLIHSETQNSLSLSLSVSLSLSLSLAKTLPNKFHTIVVRRTATGLLEVTHK